MTLKEEFRKTIQEYTDEGLFSPEEFMKFNEWLDSVSESELFTTFAIVKMQNWDNEDWDNEDEEDGEYGFGGDWWKNT